jgi:hypothetical protein
MSNDLITELINKQDALDSRKDKLLSKFVLFREEFLQGLDVFIESALSSGLRSMGKLKRIKEIKELIEAEFTLNGMELVMISNNDAFEINKIREELAAKIFIYESGDENNTPLIEVAFIESGNYTYRILAQWFSKNGPHLLSGNLPFSEEAGTRMVSIIVNYFYRLQFSWRDEPTIKATLGKVTKRSLGFIKE